MPVFICRRVFSLVKKGYWHFKVGKCLFSSPLYKHTDSIKSLLEKTEYKQLDTEYFIAHGGLKIAL